MTNGSGVSRGDRNRNARLVRLRSAVPVTNAIVGIDLADRKQMVVAETEKPRVSSSSTAASKPQACAGRQVLMAARSARSRGSSLDLPMRLQM